MSINKSITIFNIYLFTSVYLLTLLFITIFFFTPNKVMAASGNWDDYCSNNQMEGDGTQANPYIIKSAENFAYISKAINDGIGNYNTAFYKQTYDIDLIEHFWVPMQTFAGVYDGNGYQIKNLTADNSLSTFALIINFSGTWKNSAITNININLSGLSENYKVSGFAVDILNNSFVSTCFISGSIHAKTGGVTRDTEVGGFAVNTSGTIRDCYSICSISAEGSSVFNSGSTKASGIAAVIAEGTIQNCYYSGNIFVRFGYWKVGGIVAYPNNGSIIDCAVMMNSCSQNNNVKNDFINQQYENTSEATLTNCLVVSVSNLQSQMSELFPNWNYSNDYQFQTWGYPNINSYFYNNGLPALSIFFDGLDISMEIVSDITANTQINSPSLFFIIKFEQNEQHTFSVKDKEFITTFFPITQNTENIFISFVSPLYFDVSVTINNNLIQTNQFTRSDYEGKCHLHFIMTKTDDKYLYDYSAFETNDT